jgi:Ca2+-transporting ATPase
MDAYAQPPESVAQAMGVVVSEGLSGGEASARMTAVGPNAIRREEAPSAVQIAVAQLRDPMNIMLIAVSGVSILIGEISTAAIVGVLILLNLVLGTRQELKARASVDALAQMQVPQARVRRDGTVQQIAATELVPGDVLEVEAGDIVPADARIVRSATLETQEAALTGESAPVGKSSQTLDAGAALGDRYNMLFQNTSVTRGTASAIVTATGMQTEMGRIAAMLSAVRRTRSPLQRELDSLTKVLAAIAWGAVAFIVVVGLARGLPAKELLLLGTAMAISAIPTGMPAFVSGLLSVGAKQLADAKAIVKNLTDVETLGATSAINTDKTGTLTLNQMMVSTIYSAGSWFTVEGEGYRSVGAVKGVAGGPTPDFTRLALGLCLDSDATVSNDGATVVGDPTEAALVVLAAKLGVDAEETRRAYPRVAEVPFDSDYKFMATFHRITLDGSDHLIELVKGAPDVVLARCSRAGGPLAPDHTDIGEARAAIDAANEDMGSRGLRVLAFAARVLNASDEAVMQSDPKALAENLGFVAMVGIIDPLRPEAKDAVAVALEAGIDVRMITGDHAVTAQAIGADLGLGPGAISGAELQALSDDELVRRLPELHVFGRVSPEDKLRLARVMQESGLIVAMTGDAVNDAAALKQADIGVAMGSGSEVTKQAGRMVLTDDNFGTLVHAVEIGRRVYEKVVSYIRFQMTQLLAMVALFVAASAFDVNQGVALTPLMILFLLIFVTSSGVVIIAVDPGSPDVMNRPPRDPNVPISNRRSIRQWSLYAVTLFGAAFLPLVFGPDEPSTETASVAMTMTFTVLGLGTVFNALANRRSPASGLGAPLLRALAIAAVPVALVVLATELPGLQAGMLTTGLTSGQWMAVVGLALVLPIVIELDKAVERRRASF